MDNARLRVIRELARVYYKNLDFEEDYMHSDEWARNESHHKDTVFDDEGNDITYLLEKYLENREEE
jgi:hypothetical protein